MAAELVRPIFLSNWRVLRFDDLMGPMPWDVLQNHLFRHQIYEVKKNMNDILVWDAKSPSPGCEQSSSPGCVSLNFFRFPGILQHKPQHKPTNY